MRSKIAIALLSAMLCCTPLHAQSFLKNLGESIKKEIKKDVKKAVDKGVRDTKDKINEKIKEKVNENVNEKVGEKAQEHNNPATDIVQNVVSGAAVSADLGENVVRQSGLDYIDEYGVNHGGGILIGDILWAPVNCGFHPTDYPYGKLYQWGRKHGQGYGPPYQYKDKPVVDPDPDKSQPEIVPGPATPKGALKYPNRFYAKSDMAPFNWCKNDMKLWCDFTDDGKIYKNGAYDPCPEGWRLPDIKDFDKLIEHSSDLVINPATGQKGRWFSGPLPYSIAVPRIFLPAAGQRYCDGMSAFRGTHGAYWTLRHGGGELMVYNFTFSRDDMEVDPFGAPHDAYSVRCVKDMPGQSMW